MVNLHHLQGSSKRPIAVSPDTFMFARDPTHTNCLTHCPCFSSGLMVTERNWMLVFTWASWGGNANLPHFVEGMQFTPTEVRQQGQPQQGCSQ